MDFIKLKNFYSFKDLVQRTRRQATTGRKYFQNTYLIKDLDSKYFFKKTKTNNPLKMGKDINRHLATGHIQRVKKKKKSIQK